LKLFSEIQSQMQLLQTEFINEQNSNIQEQVIEYYIIIINIKYSYLLILISIGY